jgi:hypothetical protein
VAAYAERDMVHEMKRGTAIRLMVIGAGLLVLAVVLASLV